VAVLVSGGVDSSLALRLLVAAGHRVAAFYLQIWFVEDFRNTWDACPWEEDLAFARQARRAAAAAAAAGHRGLAARLRARPRSRAARRPPSCALLTTLFPSPRAHGGRRCATAWACPWRWCR